ncbi:Uu.00g025350.m01.CDS01 [Anthostomella pinea]|uniref:Uu.00g025350.m01.CDS01 n=1 Tax=Anthostomella pinea TaxID=933095 RepID=A0AAI8YCH7_9PEZI|nr:Uu.00g025350.m01.CDS01 [Anthostomella pinea]
MSADDQQFLDLLSSLPNQIRRYSGDVADYIDKAVEQAADNVRDSLSSTPWLPDYVRPKPPSKPPPVAIVPMTSFERVQDWVVRHKVLSGVIVCAVGYVTYRTVRKSKLLRKSRRAKRARNGGRLEVVVIAGSPALPLTKSLSLDMERRGFVVYIVCSTIEDELAVQNLSRSDIKALSIDITDPPSAGASIERFASYLQTPHAAVPRTRPNYLTLTSVILIPSLNYQTSPIATIPPSNFAGLFNTHLLHPILTIQSFLPLLTSRITPPQSSHGESQPPTPTTPRVLVFTPSIISSINPPFHAPEATVCSALSAFTEVLTAELRPLAIPVTHMQLGTFDFAGFTPTTRSGPHNPGLLPPAETLQWPEAARHTYGRNYVSQSESAISAGRIRGLRGSSLRELHNAVFDVVDGSEKSDVVRVGLGAGLYGFVGRWAPRSLVSWMMGIRRVDELSTWEGGSLYNGSGSERSRSTSGSESGEAGEFIEVAKGDESGINVWKET